MHTVIDSPSSEIVALEARASEYAILAEGASSFSEVVRYRDLEKESLDRAASLRSQFGRPQPRS